MSIARYFNPRLRPRLLVGDEPAWLRKHPRRGYIVSAVISAPSWVDRRELTALHLEAKRRSETTGVDYVCAHIVPLNHPYVCGLTVPWNLTIKTRAQNAHEGNRFHPDQLELFHEATI